MKNPLVFLGQVPDPAPALNMPSSAEVLKASKAWKEAWHRERKRRRKKMKERLEAEDEAEEARRQKLEKEERKRRARENARASPPRTRARTQDPEQTPESEESDPEDPAAPPDAALASAPPSAAMRKLEIEYTRALAQGDVPTSPELKEMAEKLGVKLSRRQRRSFQNRWLGLAMYVEKRRPSSHRYITNAYPRYGTFQTDYAVLDDDWGKGADGLDGFIVFVEYNTNYLFVYPCKNKDVISYEAAINSLVETAASSVKKIYSDQEGALWSEAFQKELLAKHGIGLAFLKTRSKAYLAEGAIKWLKKKLSSIRRTLKVKNWVRVLKGLVKKYNESLVPGTNFKRQQVNEENFVQFLEEKTKRKSSRDLMNAASFSCRSLPDKWSKKLFKFKLGSRILVTVMLFKSKNKFHKKSMLGWSKKDVHFVAGRYLKMTKEFNLTPGTGARKVILPVERRSQKWPFPSPPKRTSGKTA